MTHQVPIAVEQLGQVLGPTTSFHICECHNGGCILIVDGAVHSAHSTRDETVAAIGKVAHDRGRRTPEEARDVTPAPTAEGASEMARRFVRPPKTYPRPVDEAAPAETGTTERMRTTVSLALAFLAAGMSAVVGV